MKRIQQNIRGGAGFTLIELLVVMGLLVGFTYMAVRLLSGGLTIWKIADESRDMDERSRSALDLLHYDLWLSDGSPRARFVVDYNDTATTAGATSVCRLRFVRTVGRTEEARLRLGFAGAAAADAGLTAASRSATAAVRPPAGTGLLEAAWSLVPDPQARNASLLQLRRVVKPLDPDDDSSSVFAKDFFTKSKKGFSDPSLGGDVIGGVLHFHVLLASQRTTAFDKPVAGGGPETAWDSTRGTFLTKKAVGANRFSMVMDPPAGARDRVFPRRVKVQLFLAREDADRRVFALARDSVPGAREFVLDDPTPMRAAAGDFVKIGGEMMEVASVGPRSLSVRGRAALGTRVEDHKAGAVVHLARAYSMEVPVDCWRDADPLTLERDK